MHVTLCQSALESNLNYYNRAENSANPLICQLVKEYNRGFTSRTITKATPLCASKKSLQEFYKSDVSHEDLYLLELDLPETEI
ncbi:hypothetical protein BpHYR1_005622 [Brachionus plicatilis]|uniref:Uncharacterized protein n=1 Tax=Brachionus plicatilis TaxID=10195 RepID=A0A3M7PN95_BRAPC|nr:hypothetical protein BpHYR1_005622 [Brachionus plicatilis]